MFYAVFHSESCNVTFLTVAGFPRSHIIPWVAEFPGPIPGNLPTRESCTGSQDSLGLRKRPDAHTRIRPSGSAQSLQCPNAPMRVRTYGSAHSLQAPGHTHACGKGLGQLIHHSAQTHPRLWDSLGRLIHY